jgi:hypothetical protein
MMDRRRFLKLAASAPVAGLVPAFAATLAFGAAPAGADYRRLLILIELKGGNDGLNTLVPFMAYYALREARDGAARSFSTDARRPASPSSRCCRGALANSPCFGASDTGPTCSHARQVWIRRRRPPYLQDGWLCARSRWRCAGSFAINGA